MMSLSQLWSGLESVRTKKALFGKSPMDEAKATCWKFWRENSRVGTKNREKDPCKSIKEQIRCHTNESPRPASQKARGEHQGPSCSGGGGRWNPGVPECQDHSKIVKNLVAGYRGSGVEPPQGRAGGVGQGWRSSLDPPSGRGWGVAYGGARPRNPW